MYIYIYMCVRAVRNTSTSYLAGCGFVCLFVCLFPCTRALSPTHSFESDSHFCTNQGFFMSLERHEPMCVSEKTHLTGPPS